jgi:hypothetical protein
MGRCGIGLSFRRGALGFGQREDEHGLNEEERSSVAGAVAISDSASPKVRRGRI